MRSEISAALALAAAASLGACNQVFGLDPTKAAPDAPTVPLPIVHLGFLDAVTEAGGHPTAPIDVPLDDLVLLEASTLDGTEHATLTDDHGTLSIPRAIFDAPWRLVYQRRGGVIHELHQLPEGAHVAEPLFGPVARSAPAVGAGYAITPTSYTGDHGLNRVFTTGTWTEGFKVLPPAGAAFAYDFQASAKSLSGPIGRPVAPDRGLLVDYYTDSAGSNCRVATGSVDFPAELGAGVSAVGGTWSSSSKLQDITVPILELSNVLARISLLGETQGLTRLQFGYVPSAQMPAFSRPPDGDALLLLPNPVIASFAVCPDVVSMPPAVHKPVYMNDRFPRAVHIEMTYNHPVPGGPTLRNGIASVVREATADKFVVTHDAAAPVTITLTSSTGAPLQLLGATEGATLGSTAGLLDLVWTSSPGLADYWEVALLKVSGGTVTRERVWVTPASPLKIVGSDLAPATTYLLELTSYTGRPGPSVGEYRMATLPQSMALVNTRTFKTP